VDLPDADLGIIVAASKSRRQIIQRMGRILRPKQDGRAARFVVLYISGTAEDPATGAHQAFLGELLPPLPHRRKTFAVNADRTSPPSKARCRGSKPLAGAGLGGRFLRCSGRAASMAARPIARHLCAHERHDAWGGTMNIDDYLIPVDATLPAEFAGMAKLAPKGRPRIGHGEGIVELDMHAGAAVAECHPLCEGWMDIYVRRYMGDGSIAEVLVARHDGYEKEAGKAEAEPAGRYPGCRKEFSRSAWVRQGEGGS
jgi:hypothetical protein